jgi:Zn-dependent protease
VGGSTRSVIVAGALILIGVLIPSVIIHEIAHGWVALRFGDDTAKRAGRLTLNPVPHIDLFGTVILGYAAGMATVHTGSIVPAIVGHFAVTMSFFAFAGGRLRQRPI